MEHIKIERDVLLSHIAVIVTVLSGFFYLLGSLLQRFYLKSFGISSSDFSKPVAEHISAGFMHFITVQSLLILFVVALIYIPTLRRFGINNVYVLTFAVITTYLPITSMLNGGLFAEGVERVGSEVNVCTKQSTGEHCYCGKIIIQDASKLALLVESKAYVFPFGNINHYYVMQDSSKGSCLSPVTKAGPDKESKIEN
ncbi:hypothetical protein ACN5YO_004670 [Vibrio parahaemolyticus]|nr:hypothetical protein [Vibrio parahaemolyticus]